MKKLFMITILLIMAVSACMALVAGDIAIIGVNSDAPKSFVFVALSDIPANTIITFTDNAWTSATGPFGTTEGNIQWSNTSITTKGTSIIITCNTSPYLASLGTITTDTNMNLSATGDQIISFVGNWASRPTSSSDPNFMYAFSLENFISTGATTSNISYLPSALSSYSVAMTSSSAETDNAYFANGSGSQTTVTVSGTKAELLVLFNDNTKYYKNDAGPLTFPTYTITVNTGGVTTPTTQASNVTFGSVQQNQMGVSWTNGDGAKRVVIMNTENTFTTPGEGTDPTPNTIYSGSGQQVVYNNSSNSVTVTGLSASTTYWFRVYEYNGSGATTKYLASTATNNPNSQITSAPTPTITTGAVSTSPFYVDASTSATGSVAYTTTGNYSGATFTAYLSDATGAFGSPVNIGSASVTGSAPTGSITISIPAGTADGTGYKIRIDSDIPAVTGSLSSAFTVQNGAKNVTGVNSSVNTGTLTVSWTNPTTIYDEVMIVAKATTSISASPTGDGSAYSTGLAYGTGTAFDSGYVVYKGSTSPQTITALTNGTLYYVKIFTRKNSNWSSGVEISNTPAPLPALTELILPQYIQGLNGTNNQRVPWACRLKLVNLLPSSTYRFTSLFVISTDLPTYSGAGIEMFVSETGSFSLSTLATLTTAGQYGEFTTNSSGEFTGWFMGSASGNERFTPGNNVYYRIVLNNGNNGTSAVTYLTTANGIKVINFGVQDNVNQGTFIYGVSQAPAKDFVFLYDNEAGIGRPISGNVIESDGLDLSGVTSILASYKNEVDGNAGAWGTIIPNSTPTKGFTGIKRIEARVLSNGNIYAAATDSDGIWPSGISTVNPTGGDITPIALDEGDATLPVELSSFTAIVTPQNYVRLDWITQSETGVSGYYLYRNSISNLNGAQVVSPLITASNTSQEQSYSFTDSEVMPGTYYYWLQNMDMDGQFDFHGPIYVTLNDDNGNTTPIIPLLTSLQGIYPNPFNPTATISFGLAKAEQVNIQIYNIRGEKVRSFLSGAMNSGTYRRTWDGTDDNGHTLTSGVYYIKMTAGKYSSVQKAILMK